MRPIALLLILTVLVHSVFCQTLPMGLTGKGMLLAIPEIKKEIKLTKDQEKAIKTIMENLQANPSQLGGFPDMHYIMRGMDKKIVEVLDDTQKQRLHEIFLQDNGLLCLTEEEVSKPLGIAPDSLTKALAIIDKLMDDIMANLMETQKKGTVDMKKLDSIKAQSQIDLNALLTPELAEKWKTMQGTPFKFPKVMRRS